VLLLDRRQQLVVFVGVGVDCSGDEFVFGLEVVVDVADRHAGGLRDVSDGRGFDPLAVNRFARAGYQAVSAFPGLSLVFESVISLTIDVLAPIRYVTARVGMSLSSLQPSVLGETPQLCGPGS